MSNFSISPSKLLVISSAVGTGMKSNIKEAISPENIFQYIINFFTFGGITRGNKQEYYYILELMTNALTQKSNPIKEGNPLYLNDENGCSISFTPSKIDGKFITLEISKGGYTESCNIDYNIFIRVCDALVLRKEFDIPQDHTPLTENGKINLRGVDLSRKDLSKRNLSNVDFTGSSLFKSDLSRANLVGSVFSNANLTHCGFSYANLGNASLSGVKAHHAVFFHSILENADISCSDFSNANFVFANLSGADASHTKLFNVDLLNANIEGTDLTCANLNGAKLHSNILTSASKLPSAKIDKIQDYNDSELYFYVRSGFVE